MSYYLKYICFFEILVIMVLIGSASSSSGQSFDLRFVEEVNNGSRLEVKVQLSFSTVGAVGSSNLVFSYDGTKVGSPVLESVHNFSQSVDGNYRILTLTAPDTDLSSLNIELQNDNAGTSLSAGVWTDVATISFTILDNTGSADFQWQLSDTQQTVAYLGDNATFLNSDMLENENIVLPVELISFTAIHESSHVTLDWTTVTELNNDYFEIYRSSDGRTWNYLDEMAGAGTTSQTQHYKYIDDGVSNGSWYYRLKQVDYDGVYEYSEILWVSGDASGNVFLNVFPNPILDNLTIQIQGMPSFQSMAYRIMTTSGKIVVEGVLNSTSTDDIFTTIPIPSSLVIGTYLLQISSLERSFVHKLIKSQ